MIKLLIAISFAAGVLAPFITTVAFVLYFSVAAATGIAAFAFLYGADFWSIVIAWLATIVAMQAGFALSIAATALLNQRERKHRHAPEKPVRSAGSQDHARETAMRDNRRNTAGS